MEFKIIENENSFVVKTKIPERRLAKDPIEYCDANAACCHLEESGHSAAGIINGEHLVITNARGNFCLTGEWEFVKIKNSKKTTRVRNQRAKSRKRKTE